MFKTITLKNIFEMLLIFWKLTLLENFRVYIISYDNIYSKINTLYIVVEKLYFQTSSSICFVLKYVWSICICSCKLFFPQSIF